MHLQAAAFTFFAVVLTLSGSLVAQQPSRNTGGVSHVQVEPRKISIKFGSGSLSAYIRGLNEQLAGEAARAGRTSFLDAVLILDSENADSFQLPKIEMHRVLPELALLALDGSVSDGYQLDVKRVNDVVVVNFRELRSAQPPVVKVFDVTSCLARMDEKTFLSAVELGIQMVSQADDSLQVELKLHQETGLMFVRGSADQIEIVREITDQVRDGRSNPNRLPEQ